MIWNILFVLTLVGGAAIYHEPDATVELIGKGVKKVSALIKRA